MQRVDRLCKREEEDEVQVGKRIELVDEIPKSASGKILRRLLRDRSKQAEGVVGDASMEKAKL